MQLTVEKFEQEIWPRGAGIARCRSDSRAWRAGSAGAEWSGEVHADADSRDRNAAFVGQSSVEQQRHRS